MPDTGQHPDTGLTPQQLSLQNGIGWVILSSLFVYCMFPLSTQFLPALIGLIGLALMKWKSIPLKFSIERKNIALFLALPLLGTLSSIWSIAPAESLSRGIKICAEIILTFSFPILLTNLHETTTNIIKRYFHIPLIAAGTLLGIELNTGLPALHLIYPDTTVHGWAINKNVSIFGLLLPLATFLCVQAKTYKELAILALPTIAVLYATDSQATQLSTLLMMFAATIGYFSVRLLLLGACTGLVILLCSFPWIAPPLYKNLASSAQGSPTIMDKASFYARLEIWDFISATIKQRPLTGYGMDTTREMTFQHEKVYHRLDTVRHPHNTILQIWSDLGLLGIGTLLFMIGLSAHSLLKNQPRLILTSMVVFSGLSIYLLVSWSIWANWLVGFIVLLYALTCLAGTTPKDHENLEKPLP